ncbi:MAG TPA: hypothetical protein VFA48_04605 [Gammaproteobacteria bacterium]|nr:hypothetical protein [Gammaproteobacteria bacterium]
MNGTKLFCAGILFIASVTVVRAAPTTAEGQQHSLPASVAGSTLNECVNKLNRQGGGWCSLGTKFFKSAASPTSLPYFKSLRGGTGASSIFTAWNGMAVDLKHKKLYFVANGGHSDYMGDGVYEFNLATGQWTRLRDPCPLALTVRRGTKPPYGFISWNHGAQSTRIPKPSCGPAAAHTYDGVQFASKTGTIFWVSGIYAMRGGSFHSSGSLWEFNPSKTETRDRIKPLSWKRHDMKVAVVPTSVELPNGWLLYGANSHKGVMFDPSNPDGTATAAPDLGRNYGEGNLILDKSRHALWFVSPRHGILRIGLDGKHSHYADTAVGFGMGAAVRNGQLVLWNGGRYVSEFNPDTKKYTLMDWAGKMPPSSNSQVFSKWIYLKKDDVFVGVSTAAAGVLVYKMPSNVKGRQVSTVNPQHFIDAAKPGSTITIPRGTYKTGIYINKPLTVNMLGARFMAPIQGKGKVVVNAPGPVVLNGLTVTSPPGCHTNCAGLRVEGADYNVTLRNATILNQEMGILTANEGGRLVIEDSDLGETGPHKQTDLSHVIYAGWSDQLIIKNSKIHGSHRLGHLVKSRARKTVIEDSQILAEHTRNSRLVEIPCGGRLKIINSVLQQSDQTDNPEFMRLGGGSKRVCAGHSNWPVHLTMRGDRLISYRCECGDEPAKDYGPTGLMHYNGINPPRVNVKGGNIILHGNVNEIDKATGRASIQVLWYKNDQWGKPPPVANLKGPVKGNSPG